MVCPRHSALRAFPTLYSRRTCRKTLRPAKAVRTAVGGDGRHPALRLRRWHDSHVARLARRRDERTSHENHESRRVEDCSRREEFRALSRLCPALLARDGSSRQPFPILTKHYTSNKRFYHELHLKKDKQGGHDGEEQLDHGCRNKRRKLLGCILKDIS